MSSILCGPMTSKEEGKGKFSWSFFSDVYLSLNVWLIKKNAHVFIFVSPAPLLPGAGRRKIKISNVRTFLLDVQYPLRPCDTERRRQREILLVVFFRCKSLFKCLFDAKERSRIYFCVARTTFPGSGKAQNQDIERSNIFIRCPVSFEAL